jgi:putative glutamine amidotransferase
VVQGLYIDIIINNYDRFIYDFCLKKDIPYLGICLGFQVMTDKIEIVDNHYNKYHKIYINKDSKLYKIYNKELLFVNSRHHYRVVKTNNFISAKSIDGVIEAIEVLNKKFIVGVQWHPEDLNDELLFNEFIKNCL